MNKLRFPLLIKLLLAMSIIALGAYSMNAADPCMLEHYTAPKISIHDDFIKMINDTWQGKAIRTPIGPVNYDITYRQTPEGMVQGSADLIASVHHWTFIPEAENLKLCFLSTFAGNTEPLLLELVEVDENEYFFKAHDPSYLEVRINITENSLRKRIFLRGNPHVEIELAREVRNK